MEQIKILREKNVTEHDNVSAEIDDLRQYFRALSGALRLRLLRELALEGEMSVSRLVAALRVSQPLVSWHLRFLKRIGLLHLRRAGRQVYYSLNRAQLKHYQDLLASFLGENDSA